MRWRKRVWPWENPELHSEDRTRKRGSQRISSCDRRDQGTTNLATKLVITTFKLGIEGPNKDVYNSRIPKFTQIRTKLVRANQFRVYRPKVFGSDDSLTLSMAFLRPVWCAEDYNLYHEQKGGRHRVDERKNETVYAEDRRYAVCVWTCVV